MEYLTEHNLEQYLNIIYPDVTWIEDKCFSPYKFRPDYINHKLKIAIEFDGYAHYTQSKIIIADINKDNILKGLNYKIIRIPYFVQLDSKSIKILFDKDINLTNNYPHGFIDKKVIFPADFCELGIIKFKQDLQRFEQLCILDSIKNKLKDGVNINLLLPPSLQSYIKNI